MHFNHLTVNAGEISIFESAKFTEVCLLNNLKFEDDTIIVFCEQWQCRCTIFQATLVRVGILATTDLWVFARN